MVCSMQKNHQCHRQNRPPHRWLDIRWKVRQEKRQRQSGWTSSVRCKWKKNGVSFGQQSSPMGSILDMAVIPVLVFAVTRLEHLRVHGLISHWWSSMLICPMMCSNFSAERQKACCHGHFPMRLCALCSSCASSFPTQQLMPPCLESWTNTTRS